MKFANAWQALTVSAVTLLWLAGQASAGQGNPPPMPPSSCALPDNNVVSPTTCYIDLTTSPSSSGVPVGSPAVLNGGIFSTPDIANSLGKGTIVGTGVFQPFVRIQEGGTGSGNGVEQGFNTNGTGRYLDNHDKGDTNWNHAIKLSEVGQVCLSGGACYYEFLLDINEQGNDKNAGLSLDEFKLFTAASGTLTEVTGTDDTKGYNPLLNIMGANLRYDMDGVGGGDASILMDYANYSGSGNGVDLQVLVPVLNFANAGANDFVYLFSKFGVTGNTCNINNPNHQTCVTPGGGTISSKAGSLDFSQDAGFEEWSMRKQAQVPLPGVPLLIGIALAGLAFTRRAGRRQAVR